MTGFIKHTNIITFVSIPIMTIILIISSLRIISAKDNDIELLTLLLIIFLINIVILIIYGVTFSRISRNNKMRTDYLLTQQKMELYEDSVLKTGKQIEKMSKIKHDMKNHLINIETLINQKNYGEAERICTELSQNLQKVYTPINTENILLNAIINVEQDKAENENIFFKIEISDYLNDFSGNSDIISVIGNICDNAIEYLKNQPHEERMMSLKISKVNDYAAIICKNKITDSVLEKNSHLKTSKNDRENHGKGTNIVREICIKYSGNVSYKEENNEFIATVLLKPQIEEDI